MFTRGIELLAGGNPGDALHEFRESLSDAVGDQQADSLYNIAICYVKLGNVDAALQAVSEALRIDPALANEIETDEDFLPLASSEAFREALAAADREQFRPSSANVQGIEGLRYAGFVSRAVALTIDLLLIGFLLSFQSGTVGSSVPLTLFWYLFFAAVTAAYPVYFHARWGQTVGKMVAKIKVTQLDGAPIAFRHAFLRSSVDIALVAIWAVSLIHVLVNWMGPDWSSLGFLERGRAIAEQSPISRWYDLAAQLWVGSELVVLLTNKKRRALHDFIAGTVVVQKESLPAHLALEDLRFQGPRSGVFAGLDRKRVALAVLLVLLVLFLYQLLIVPG